MMLWSVIKKSILEQIRSFWILFLTVCMAPFFVVIYYLISESEEPSYDIVVVNQDDGLVLSRDTLNYGKMLVTFMEEFKSDTFGFPLTVEYLENRAAGIRLLKSRKSDALVVIPAGFTRVVNGLLSSSSKEKIEIEFVGDLTNYEYMVCAIWAGEIMDQAVFHLSGTDRPFEITETIISGSGKMDDFDYYIPGILVLSIIMLMFSASIALIMEVENKTILRLKLSRIGSFRLLSGISIVQVMVGIISILITLLVAVWLGFDYTGSILVMLFIAVLTCLSIVAFSLVIAGITKTSNEILIVGNFPLFLFMFFTGAAFPINGKALFSLGDYAFTIQGLMSPTHAVSAIRKTMILDMGIGEVLPELAWLMVLTILYFLAGVWVFRKRHMKVR